VSLLLDKLLTREQLAQCRQFDSAQWPPRRVECAEEGHVTHVPYSIGRIQAESSSDPWLWRLIPAAIAAGAILTAWFEVAA
jgi:hypothetical protein